MRQNRERDERLQIMLSAEELRALDDFRFKNRMPSRASAIREILRRGLGVDGQNGAEAGSKSSDFGVLGATENGRQRKRATS
jgi:metal-responsive CopG/Arc/MetJ family transcriptional regulator